MARTARSLMHSLAPAMEHNIAGLQRYPAPHQWLAGLHGECDKYSVGCQRDISHPSPLLPAAHEGQVGQLDTCLACLEIAGDGQDKIDASPAQTAPKIIGVVKGECSTLRQPLAPCCVGTRSALRDRSASNRQGGRE